MEIEIKDLEFGDYCHATKCSDCDPKDPWFVGFLSRVAITEDGEVRYYLRRADQTGGWDVYGYQHCRKIEVEEGKEIVEQNGWNKIWAKHEADEGLCPHCGKELD